MPALVLKDIDTKINDTIEVENITYCWHDGLERYTWCQLQVNHYDVDLSKFFHKIHAISFKKCLSFYSCISPPLLLVWLHVTSVHFWQHISHLCGWNDSKHAQRHSFFHCQFGIERRCHFGILYTFSILLGTHSTMEFSSIHVQILSFRTNAKR